MRLNIDANVRFRTIGRPQIVSEGHTANRSLRYGKITPAEAPVLLGYREANSEGFSVWGV